MRRYLCIAAAGAIWCAVAQAQQPAAPAPAPANHQPTPAPSANGGERRTMGDLVQRSGGSLLRATVLAAPNGSKNQLANWSLIYVPEPEPRTMKKHDLLTIIIREQSQFSSDGTTDLKKDAAVDARINEMIKFANGKITGGGVTDPKPAINMSGARNFKGEATVDRSDSFVMRIAAEVVDVKPNGTFTIQATKVIKNDEEEQQYLLTGICRGADVTPDNTILSTQIANLEVVSKHTGAVRDSTKRGWVPRILDFVNPF